MFYELMGVLNRAKFDLFKYNNRVPLSSHELLKISSDRLIESIKEHGSTVLKPVGENGFCSRMQRLWLPLPKEEFSSLDNELIFYGDGVIDYIDDDDSQVSYEFWSERDAISYIPLDIVTYHLRGGDEYRFIVGDHLFLFDKSDDVLVTVPDVEQYPLWPDYLATLDRLTQLAAEQILKLVNDVDCYYDDIPMKYQLSTLPVREWNIVRGKVDPDSNRIVGTFSSNLDLLAKVEADVPCTYESKGALLTQESYLSAIHTALSSIHPKAAHMSPVEAYKAFCDGRDEGLLSIGGTSDDFREWMGRKWADSSYAEVIPTSSKSTCVWIFPQYCVGSESNGFFTVCSSAKTTTKVEEIYRMTAALSEASLPVCLPEQDVYRKRIMGHSLVVFDNVFGKHYDIRSLQIHFPDDVIEFISSSSTEDAINKGVKVNLKPHT
ncbi:hypothetical protein VCHA53O466_140202 [Vibrio chagasii]|nr:hypothetical protein VCHA53O466_140202 [Vibrio chagasii]